MHIDVYSREDEWQKYPQGYDIWHDPVCLHSDQRDLSDLCSFFLQVVTTGSYQMRGSKHLAFGGIAVNLRQLVLAMKRAWSL